MVLAQFQESAGKCFLSLLAFPPTPPQLIKQVMLNTIGLGREEGVLEVVVLSKTHYSC